MMRTAKFAILISIAIGSMSAQSVVSGSVTPKTCASGVSPDFYNTSLKILYKCVGGTYGNGVPTLVPPIYSLDASVTAPIPSAPISLTPTDTGLPITSNDSPHYADVGTDGYLQFLDMQADETITLVHCTAIDCSTHESSNMSVNGDGDNFPWLAIGPDGKTRFMYEGNGGEIRFIECAVPNSDCSTHTDNVIVPAGNRYEMSFFYSSGNTITFGYTNYNNHPSTVVINKCADLQCSSVTSGGVIADGSNGIFVQDIEFNPTTKFPTVLFVSIIGGGSSTWQWKFFNCSTSNCSNGTITDLNLPVPGDYSGMLKAGSDGFFRFTAQSQPTTKGSLIRCLNATCSQNKTTILTSVTSPVYLTFGMSGNYATVAYINPLGLITWIQCANLDCTSGVTGQVGLSSGATSLSGALSGTNLLTVYTDITTNTAQYIDFKPTGAYACLNPQGNLYRSLTACN